MVFIATHGVEAYFCRELHFVHEIVVHVVRALGIEKPRMDIDPYRGVVLPEVVRQLGIGHEVEPQMLHEISCFRLVRN